MRTTARRFDSKLPELINQFTMEKGKYTCTRNKSVYVWRRASTHVLEINQFTYGEGQVHMYSKNI